MNHFVKGNPDLCMGCRTCMIACVVSHEGSHIFEIDPDSYSFNPRLHMVKTATISVPVQCKHCEDPACKAVCPNDCISIIDNVVTINTTNCIGCKNCMNACPFGAIDMTEVKCEYQAKGEKKIVANKCDLCRENPDGPACVAVCPTEALKVVSEEDLINNVEKNRQNTAKELNEASLKAEKVCK
ncbi:MAG: 4Fe-4S dicluster domain-containing protein [Eubacteriales bacterium]|nr:4Fe-4S dicluster domain-containing protein [Eubacteriales bacterium]